MPCLRRSGLVVLTALAGIAGSRVARADDSAAAQALFDQAKKAMAAHRYADACPKLEESERLQEAVGTLLNLADCYEHEGKLASAWSKYIEVASKARAAGQGARARIARDRAAALAPKLSNLVVDVPPANRADGLEIRRDGTVVGQAEWGEALPADAGTHAMEATAPGRQPWSQTVLVADGATTARVTVPELERTPVEPMQVPTAATVPESPPPVPATAPAAEPAHTNGLRIAAIVVGGVGIVGVGVGSAFGLMSLGKHNDASNLCPAPGPCRDSAGVTAWRSANDFGNVSTIAFIAGGVGLAGGTVLWLLAPKNGAPRETTAGLVVGPASVGWRGTW
jgi:hypothetical protein